MICDIAPGQHAGNEQNADRYKRDSGGTDVDASRNPQRKREEDDCGQDYFAAREWTNLSKLPSAL